MLPVTSQNSAKSMKEQNEPKLYAFTAFQFSLFALVFVLPAIPEAALSKLTTAIFAAVSLGGVTIASTVFTDVLPTSLKNQLTHLFRPASADQARKVAKRYLSGFEAQRVDDLFTMPQHTGMKERDVFDRLKEITAQNIASYQAYKKYLLVREYTIIQIFLTVILVPVSLCAYTSNEYKLEYAIYMLAIFALLVFSTWSTDLRFTQIVIKRSGFVSADVKKAVEEWRIRPIETGSNR